MVAGAQGCFFQGLCGEHCRRVGGPRGLPKFLSFQPAQPAVETSLDDPLRPYTPSSDLPPALWLSHLSH